MKSLLVIALAVLFVMLTIHDSFGEKSTFFDTVKFIQYLEIVREIYGLAPQTDLTAMMKFKASFFIFGMIRMIQTVCQIIGFGPYIRIHTATYG